MSILKAENVSFSYDKKIKALAGVSLSVEKGEYLAVLGRNGSGKSTLAKLFNALLLPDEGEVTVCGFSSADKKTVFEIRKRVGVVFQNPDNQLVASIVEDDIAFGPENLGVKREEIKERIDFALKTVGMEEFKNASPERLSGGQKQRIAIAGVLALKPEILILDESTSMLDPVGRAEVLATVEKLNKEQGVTVIAITHYMEETLGADRVIVLDNGKVAAEGSPKAIFSDRTTVEKHGLTLPLPAIIADELKKAGVPLKDGILTKEELAEALCGLK